MLERSLLLIPVLLVVGGAFWQLPAIGQPSREMTKANSATIVLTLSGQRVDGARILGTPSIDWKLPAFVISTKERETQIKPILGVPAEPYFQFATSTYRVWEPAPQSDIGLQLKIGNICKFHRVTQLVWVHRDLSQSFLLLHSNQDNRSPGQ
jgi:hypothetical protein